jgi:DNA (cytosine-5)-methyltransferase 1
MAIRRIPVIDLFSGPGGLSEGFARYGERDWATELSKPLKNGAFRHDGLFDSDLRFQIALSVEKDRAAHSTLELRAFFRAFDSSEVPDDYFAHLRQELTREALFARFPKQAKEATREAWHNALGTGGATSSTVDDRIVEALAGASNWVLIGGPPCQAYSVVGRSRRLGIKSYRPEKDDRHFLYREYLRIVAKHEPPIFVMENVKGLLSSQVSGKGMFDRILDDLSNPGREVNGADRKLRYRVYPLAPHSSDNLYGVFDPNEYVIAMEDHGIPQARHRVILLGIREDLARKAPRKLQERSTVTVSEVIGDLPILRSGVTRMDAFGPVIEDSVEVWREVLLSGLESPWLRQVSKLAEGARIRARIEGVLSNVRIRIKRGSEFLADPSQPEYASRWFYDKRIGGVCNHAARAHLADDLHRYLFAACFGDVIGVTPKLRHFPTALLPNHESATTSIIEGGNFGDRFRVQLWDMPATTITSHIRKDGHYYIHPDPEQCRSFTVREAARVQTFPDNYFFCGNRTEQYHQVGNAVPPLLAVQIAGVVADCLGHLSKNR